jgi:acyl-coenzyme A synthetase/AMP-(fatty) acid ligase
MISNSAVLENLGLKDIAATLGDFPRNGLGFEEDRQRRQKINKPCTARYDQEDLDRLAYLIFTSGSTGKPQAVLIRHKSALHVVRIGGRYVGLGPHDRFAQVASMSWDVHIIEVYGAISARATSVTCPDMIKKSGPGMQREERPWEQMWCQLGPQVAASSSTATDPQKFQWSAQLLV